MAAARVDARGHAVEIHPETGIPEAADQGFRRRFPLGYFCLALVAFASLAAIE